MKESNKYPLVTKLVAELNQNPVNQILEDYYLLDVDYTLNPEGLPEVTKTPVLHIEPIPVKRAAEIPLNEKISFKVTDKAYGAFQDPDLDGEPYAFDHLFEIEFKGFKPSKNQGYVEPEFTQVYISE